MSHERQGNVTGNALPRRKIGLPVAPGGVPTAIKDDPIQHRREDAGEVDEGVRFWTAKLRLSRDLQ